MPRIRPYRPSDRTALAVVCVRTANAGMDATGALDDDALWGDLFALPYAERDPGLAWVVEAEDGRVVGYLVATDDTDAFERWFREEWWPSRSARYLRSGQEAQTRQDTLLAVAERRGTGRESNAGKYPAHLHIDLLPQAQGQGQGRRLIDVLLTELGRRGIPGLHLAMDSGNTGAAAFYARLGFRALPSTEGTAVLGIRVPAA